MDVSKDNKIDAQELKSELSWFFANEENLQAIGALLSSSELDWENRDLLDSLEHALYDLESQITLKEEITEEDRTVLTIFIKLLWSKCEQECNKVQGIIDRYDMKQIMKDDDVSQEDISVLENYVSKLAKQGAETEHISEVKNFLEWQYVKLIIQEFDTKWRRLITTVEETRLREYFDKLWWDDGELQTRQQVAQMDAIHKILKEQENITEINKGYKWLDQSSQTLLSGLLWLTEGDDLVSKIDDFLSWEISLTADNQIKWLNVLNKVVEKDEGTHERLKLKVDEAVKNMMHSVNEVIARNDKEHASNPLSFYNKNQVKSIQLWANVCYGKNLPINWSRCDNAYSLNWNENQKLTSVYIYKLEFITRKDVIDYRRNHKLKTTDNLLDIPEFDEIFSVLSVEDQDEILMDFLSNCYFKIRQSWIYFEDKIWWWNLRVLLDMALKQRTEKDVSIEDWIEARKQLIQNLQSSTDPQDKELISSIQDEIDALSQRNSNWDYIYKTMWEFYEAQYKDLKKMINQQNKDNVDIAHRQHALKEWNEIVKDRQVLQTLPNSYTGDRAYKFKDIVKKLSDMYNSESTSQYRKWMEKWEVFDPIIIKNIAVHYAHTMTQSWEREYYGKDFTSFMRTCSDQVRDDVNKFSDILDIMSEIESIENWERKVTLDPSYGKPGEFVKNWWEQLLAEYSYGWQQLLSRWRETEPTSYELRLWWNILAPRFEWGLWLKNVYEDWKDKKIKLVITRPWSAQNKDPWELCKYEKNSNGDIILWKYGRDGTLPPNPTRTITASESTHANIAMLSAVESLNTDEFNEVMHEFSGADKTLSKLQDDIGEIVDLFNNRELSEWGAARAQTTIATIISKINWTGGTPGLKEKVSQFQDLKDVLLKMKNKNWIENQFEKWIAARIDQIDHLMEMCTPAFINKMSELSRTLKPNDAWYKNPDWQTIMNVLVDVAAIIAWIALTIATCWTGAWVATLMVVAFINTMWVSLFTKTASGLAHEYISYKSNRIAEKDRIIQDEDWNDVLIPWYVPEKQQSVYYQYKIGKITFQELMAAADKASEKIIRDSVKDATIAAVTMWIAKGLNFWNTSQLATTKDLADPRNLKKIRTRSNQCNTLIGTLVSAFMVTPVVYSQIKSKNVQQINKLLESKVYDVLPFLNKKDRSWMAMVDRLTCKSVDDQAWNRIEMEYDWHDVWKIKDLANAYREEWAEVSMKENWDMDVKLKESIITFTMSNMPAEYRSLSSDMKSKLEKLWWVNVDNQTWKISYKNPEWLVSLRGLWSYLDKTWQWELFIESSWDARLLVWSPSGQPSVINIRPEMA